MTPLDCATPVKNPLKRSEFFGLYGVMRRRGLPKHRPRSHPQGDLPLHPAAVPSAPEDSYNRTGTARCDHIRRHLHAARTPSGTTPTTGIRVSHTLHDTTTDTSRLDATG